MTVAFVNRAPTQKEIERWRLIMSTFNDGTGQERDKNGDTRLGWRDIERVAAIMLGGNGGEDKKVFDVIVSDPENPEKYYGISVKSKELSRKSAIEDLSTDGRVYIELCNSPAKLWDPLKQQGIEESDFKKGNHAGIIGQQILTTVRSWENNFLQEFTSSNPGKILSLEESIYLTISYNKSKLAKDREYQLHSFHLHFPKEIRWEFNSSRCLRGYDPNHPSETIFDWYGLSGGQLKYYPKASSAKYNTNKFTLKTPRKISLTEKASRYFPDEWINAEGINTLTPEIVSNEIKNLAKLFGATEAAILKTAASDLIK